MARLGRVSPACAVLLLLAAFISSAHAQGGGPARATKAGPSPPAAPIDDRSLRVDEALRLSGLKAHLSAIRTRLLGYLDAAQASSAESKQWIAGSLKTVYAPDVYLKPIKQALLDNYDDEAMARVLSWYRSAVGRKVTRLGSSAQEPGQAAARRKYLAGLEERQPSDYRLVLIFSIDEAAHISAGTESALRASMNGWSLGLEQIVIQGARPEIPEIEAALGKYRPELRDDVADDLLRELLYVYRDASDGDLRAWAEFLESGAGRWFIGTAFKAHQAFFAGAADQVAEDLVNAATPKQTSRPLAPISRPTESKPTERFGPPAVTSPSPPPRR